MRGRATSSSAIPSGATCSARTTPPSTARRGAVLAAGLTPIVCIGETLAEREADETAAVLDRQIDGGLAGLTADEVGSIIVAYEPVWAIGTGRTATPEQAQKAHAHVRGRLAALAGQEAADRCRLLYGGSVKPANAAELSAQPRRRRGARRRREPRPAELRGNRRRRPAPLTPAYGL